MKKSQANSGKDSSSLLRFPDEESRFPWLSMLLDSYAVIDEGISVAIVKEETGRNRKLACEKGCDICCRVNKDIPVYPIELVGIYWFATEKAEQALRETLKNNSQAIQKAIPVLFSLTTLVPSTLSVLLRAGSLASSTSRAIKAKTRTIQEEMTS